MGLGMWRRCWCQTSCSEFFSNCSSPGIFSHLKGLQKYDPTKRKHPVRDSWVEETALLVSEVRVGKPVGDNRKTAATQTNTGYNHGV